ncbi:MAG: 50S ribosomal protein L29 [bacterium]|nr:50S ribosomal protein L29 [bacterium]
MKQKDMHMLHGASLDELRTKRGEVEKKLLELFMGKASTNAKNTRQGRILRKKRAQIETLIQEKQKQI